MPTDKLAEDMQTAPAEEAPQAEGCQIGPEVIDSLLETLAGPNRRRRQEAAHTLALVAQERTEGLVGHVDELIDALYRPEAQTRWEVLAVLGELAREHAELIEDAYDGAEASLFDEDSAIVRLAAFRFLARLGESSPERSDKVWGILDEAIQCYHGDPEYRDMLVALLEFGQGDLSEASRGALLERVGFDAANGRGYIRIMSAEIVAAAQKA